MKRIIGRIMKYFVAFILLIGFFLLTINFYVLSFSSKNYFSDINNIPDSKYGLVFGASVNKNGTPSLVLQDRLDTAINSYKKQKIKKIIVSGFVSNDGYNEPVGMSRYLIDNGVSKQDIIIDETGIDTYNSLLKAKKIIGNHAVTLFTQDFHLQRAVYIADRLGIKFLGMETNLREYKKQNYFRELGARIKAFWEADILQIFN